MHNIRPHPHSTLEKTSRDPIDPKRKTLSTLKLSSRDPIESRRNGLGSSKPSLRDPIEARRKVLGSSKPSSRDPIESRRDLSTRKISNREAMETAATSLSSSGKSSTTTASSSESPETRDSCYFPGCRKDANCNCKICQASFNATLDLMPTSAQRSSRTKFSTSKPVRRSPVSSFGTNSAILSTPRSTNRRMPVPATARGSTERLHFDEKVSKGSDGEWGLGFKMLGLALGTILIFAAEFGIHSGVSRVLQPDLSPDLVRRVGEKFQGVQDLGLRLLFLQNELQGLVHGKASNCSYDNSRWKVHQDGLLLSSRCTLYKSAREEVSIWGWPLQTAGLLATEFSSPSFTILSGRVTEWSEGKFSYTIRKTNSSWVQRKWSASVVQFDPNTWVLEYRRSLVLENSRLFSAAFEFLEFWASRVVAGSIKQHFWQIPAFGAQYGDFTSEKDFRKPT